MRVRTDPIGKHDQTGERVLEGCRIWQRFPALERERKPASRCAYKGPELFLGIAIASGPPPRVLSRGLLKKKEIIE